MLTVLTLIVIMVMVTVMMMVFVNHYSNGNDIVGDGNDEKKQDKES